MVKRIDRSSTSRSDPVKTTLEVFDDNQLRSFSKEELIKIIKQYQKEHRKPDAGDLPSRKDRIDYLVGLAKNEYQRHKDGGLTVEILDNEIATKWALTHKIKEEYIIEIEKILEYKHGITLNAKEHLSKIKSDYAITQKKPYSKPSKTQYFMDILRNLGGDENKPVQESTLIDTMMSSGRFTEDESYAFIDRMKREGKIYEPKSGCYRRVAY